MKNLKERPVSTKPEAKKFSVRTHLSEYTIPLIDLQAGHDVLQRLLIHVQIENGFFGLLDSFRVVDGVLHYSYTQKFLEMLHDDEFKAFLEGQGLV